MDTNPITIHSPEPDKRDGAPMQKQHKAKRRWCGHNTSGTPWIRALLCIALVIAALVIWSVYTSKMAYTLVELITTLRLGVLAQRRVEAALRMLQGILLAVTCAIVGLVVAVALGKAAFEHRRSVQGDAKAQGCGACSRCTAYRAAIGVVLLLLWLLMVGLIFIAMLFFASGVALYGAENGALGAQSALQQLALDTNNRLDNAEDLVADMANTFIQWGEQAPKDVSSTPWYQNMQKGMGPKLQAARNLTQQPSVEQCPATCLDLRVMTVWLDDRGAQSCVCGSDRLQRLANLLRAGWQHALVAWCALMVLIAACSWLYTLGVSGYTRDVMQRTAYHNSHNKAVAGAPTCEPCV